MKILHFVLTSFTGIFLCTPIAYAINWLPCPTANEIMAANILRTFPDKIDATLWDAYASDVISTQRTWHIAIAGFQAANQTEAYKQALHVLASAGSSAELVASDPYEKNQLAYTCIFSTTIAPHPIIIASTFSVAPEKLNSMANGIFK